MRICASDYSVLNGQSVYDVDLKPMCEVDIDARGDNDFRVYAVGPDCVVPLFRGDHFRFKGKLEGFSCLQVCVQSSVDCVGWSCSVREIRDGQPLGKERIFVPLSESADDVGLSRVVQMMVRQQLRAAGFDPDADVKDFGDGDMSFDDEDEFLGSGAYDDDDDELQSFNGEPAPLPPSIPSKDGVPAAPPDPAPEAPAS